MKIKEVLPTPPKLLSKDMFHRRLERVMEKANELHEQGDMNGANTVLQSFMNTVFGWDFYGRTGFSRMINRFDEHSIINVLNSYERVCNSIYDNYVAIEKADINIDKPIFAISVERDEEWSEDSSSQAVEWIRHEFLLDKVRIIYNLDEWLQPRFPYMISKPQSVPKEIKHMRKKASRTNNSVFVIAGDYNLLVIALYKGIKQ